VQRHNQQPFSIQASTVRQSPALTEAEVDIASQKPLQEDKIEQGSAAVEVDKRQEVVLQPQH
jgi:hypothetical protein